MTPTPLTGHLLSLSLVTSLASVAAACNEPAPAAPAPHAGAVADLVGVWSGRAVGTPFGDFPMALAFDRTADGAVHTRLEVAGGHLDFRFHREGEAWLLAEEGYLPELGTQSHTLVPAPGGPGARWVDRRDAALLAVDIEVGPRTLRFVTRLRGEDHARFELDRMEGKAAEEMRARIARGAGPHADGISSHR